MMPLDALTARRLPEVTPIDPELDLLRFTVHEELVMLLRLLVGGLAGGIVGFERKSTGKRAGIRTMSLVAMGAAIFTLASQFGFFGSNVDGSRVAAQVATGVGFIGAGTIVVHRGAVRGLTTAAAIWMSAALGLAAGAGMFVIAIVGAVLTTVTLSFLPHGEPSYDDEPDEVAPVEDPTKIDPTGEGRVQDQLGSTREG